MSVSVSVSVCSVCVYMYICIYNIYGGVWCMSLEGSCGCGVYVVVCVVFGVYGV